MNALKMLVKPVVLLTEIFPVPVHIAVLHGVGTPTSAAHPTCHQEHLRTRKTYGESRDRMLGTRVELCTVAYADHLRSLTPHRIDGGQSLALARSRRLGPRGCSQDNLRCESDAQHIHRVLAAVTWLR